MRPGSPDNAPLIGPTRLDGLVIATGHYRNGILLTPVTGDEVATLIADGKVPAILDGVRSGPRSAGRPHLASVRRHTP